MRLHARVSSPSDNEPASLSIGSPNGTVLRFGPTLPRVVDGYEYISLWISVEADGLRATSLVCTIEGGTGPYCLTQFVRELADDWRGEQGERTFNSFRHEFSITATRDALGHVLLLFALRQSDLPDAWEAQVNVEVDAGEAMARFARDIQKLLDDA